MDPDFSITTLPKSTQNLQHISVGIYQTILELDYSFGPLGYIHIMRDYDNRLSQLLKFVENLDDLGSRLTIEVTGRFIGEDDIRFVGQGACDRRPLHLTARHFSRLVVDLVGKSYPGENFHHALFAILSVGPGKQQGDFDILERGGIRQKIKRLKNKTYLLVTDIGQLVGSHVIDRFTLQKIFTAGGNIETADDIHQR